MHRRKQFFKTLKNCPAPAPYNVLSFLSVGSRIKILFVFNINLSSWTWVVDRVTNGIAMVFIRFYVFTFFVICKAKI